MAAKYNIGDDFRRRIKEIKLTRWIRFGLVSLLFLLWVIWMRTWWLAIFEILLFDIYITGYIPFTWWKKSESKTVRGIMGWVDAIVYALILVYFVFAFIGQNYQIPSSSLEKTLLTGDYLWVNKFVYGPRVPMTPVNFPLVHNSFLGHKSYLDHPYIEYRRLKGLRKVEEGDIVVFNFPAGDTVSTKFEDTPQYYDILVKQYGRDVVHNNKIMFGDIIYRPVDRRQNFVKRAIALPGQYLKIVNDTVYIDGVVRDFPEKVQFNYLFATSSPLSERDLKSLDISPDDISQFEEGSVSRKNVQPFLRNAPANATAYIAPLTQGMIERMKEKGKLLSYIKFSNVAPFFYGNVMNSMVFPFGEKGSWTLSNYGGDNGLFIPAKGSTIELNSDNWITYQRCIRNYEGHTDAYFDENLQKVIIDGKVADYYTFELDYYWMMGDNRDNSQDSRFWGFVPEDHIIGTPMIILASFDNNRRLFDGRIRFNRIFRSANPDKK
ncbi:MAG: signal peptidase I [Muribaculaceae bacterium]|nr:signal peptidase I [Muribaculaceae bacterium]